MNETTNKDSPAQGYELKPNDVVFCRIYRKDRKWIHETKGSLRMEERLHEIIAAARRDEE